MLRSVLLRSAPRPRRPRSRWDGPYPRLPRPLDALSDRWSRLRPRVRALVGVVVVLAVGVSISARIEREQRRWGGAPVRVLVAVEDMPAGSSEPAVRSLELPPAAVPPDPLARFPDGATLALAAPEGTVLTRAHLDPRGPAAGLPAGSRAVPIPVESGWGVTAGGRVDVWVLGAETDPAQQVARAALVLEVTDDGSAATALVGLAEDEVGPTTAGLALGRVLLTHAP